MKDEAKLRVFGFVPAALHVCTGLADCSFTWFQIQLQLQFSYVLLLRFFGAVLSPAETACLDFTGACSAEDPSCRSHALYRW